MNDWIEKLFELPELKRMGHGQRGEDLNLGLGWLYYALARLMRPQTVVVIGSYRGFTPLVFGKAMMENVERGRILFIDPSLIDDFWKDAGRVKQYFASMGVTNVEHHRFTTQDFVHSDAYRALDNIGIVFVDGYHSLEQARFDHEAFAGKLAPNGIVCFHDTAKYRVSKMYGEGHAYQHRVKDYTDTLKNNPALQVFDFPFFDGVTLVRRVEQPVEAQS